MPFTSSARCPASVDETAAVGTAVQRLKASATKESALAPRSMGLEFLAGGKKVPQQLKHGFVHDGGMEYAADDGHEQKHEREG